MVNITLGEYRICTVEKGKVAMYKRHIITKRSSPNLGTIVESIDGYHSSLKSALLSYTEKEIASKDYCAKTVEQLEAVLDHVAFRIEKALKGREQND